ncbi:hypothetical protein NFI96_023053 [Prochilodus magdalenae]|nr:hypothetical protein NFI96_023053 [Prochilodus magdalenae]
MENAKGFVREVLKMSCFQGNCLRSNIKVNVLILLKLKY